MKYRSAEEIGEELKAFIKAEILDQQVEIKYDTPFSTLGISSLSIIEIVLFIERKFGISLSETDLVPENLKSIKTIAERVEKHQHS